MSVKSTIEFYKRAEYLHKQISDVFNEFEAGKIPEEQQDTIISRTLDDISKLNNTLNKIDLHDLEDSYDVDTIEDVEHNVDFYYEAADYIEKVLTAKKYYDSLLNGVNALIKKMSPSQMDYNNYAKTESELAKKFTAMLLHPNNINQFTNQIKRMALGTMSQNEFKKIFFTNKKKMQKLPKRNFQSFDEYKEDKQDTDETQN